VLSHRLQKGNFTKEMEGLVFAAQEQALSINSIKAQIYKMPCSPKRRLCGVADETVDHLISSCSFLVQYEYKGRHNAITSLIHWTLLKQPRVQVQTPWWKHVPTAVLDTHDFKLL